MKTSLNAIDRLVGDIPIPRAVKVRQRFERPFLKDVEAVFLDRLHTSGVLASVRPGMSMAIAVGSRGIANQPLKDAISAKGRR